MSLIASQQAASAADLETAITVARVTLQDAQQACNRLMHVGPTAEWHAARAARDEAQHALADLIRQRDFK